MIVINLPFYIPTRSTTKTLTFARDSIEDADNLYIHYAGSTVYPLYYYSSDDGGSTWQQHTQTINSPADLVYAKSFPLDAERQNPREPFNPNTDGTAWRLDLKNYVIIDKAGSTEYNNEQFFKYTENNIDYLYNIHDGAWLSIQSNIITSDGKYVGASRMNSMIVDMTKYEQVDENDVPYKSALLFTPLCMPALNVVDDQLQLQDPTTFKHVLIQSVENDGYCRLEGQREHWCVKSAIPCGDSGLFGCHFVSRDFNVLFKLNWNSIDNGEDWDLAVIRFTVLDEIRVSCINTSGYNISDSAPDATYVRNFLEETDRFPEPTIPPVIYCVHRDENMNIIGVTRLGFLNETTEIVVKKHINSTTGNPVYDDVYIVGGSSRRKVDVGFSDIRFYKKVA